MAISQITGNRYPHMMPLEVPIWEMFLEHYNLVGNQFVYDLRVGDGSPIEDESDEALKKVRDALTRKRIDAVLVLKDAVWIFEVKPSATLSALGQVTGYGFLYRKTFGYNKNVRLFVVTDKVQPDVLPVAESMDVAVVQTDLFSADSQDVQFLLGASRLYLGGL